MIFKPIFGYFYKAGVIFASTGFNITKRKSIISSKIRIEKQIKNQDKLLDDAIKDAAEKEVEEIIDSNKFYANLK